MILRPFSRRDGRGTRGVPENVRGQKWTSHGAGPGPRNHGENWHPALPGVRSKGSAEIGVEVTPSEGGFVIHAEGQHVEELRALFQQHGINCQLHPEQPAAGGGLVFSRETDVEQLKEILDSYKNPKGS
jgi:hypothetical protein